MPNSTALTLTAATALLFLVGCQTVKPTAELTVRELALPETGNFRQHELTHTVDNKLIVSWVETKAANNTVRFAIYDDGAWSPVQTVASTQAKLAASPAVFGLDDGSLSAFWMQAVKNEKDRYAADIYWVRSQDGGQTWTTPTKPYGAQARIYDAQMSLAAMPDANMALVWTDSRHVNRDEDPKAAHKTSRYQVMAAILGKDGEVGKEMVLDNDVCSCCRVYTDAENDGLVTVYRDHLKGEVRDISAVRWQPGGVLNSSPVHDDNWVINGCPSNGPSVDLSNNRAVVAWFSAGDGNAKVSLSFAADNKPFNPPIVVDDHAVGFTKALLLDDGSALVVWRSNAGPEEELMLAQVTPEGKISHRKTLFRGGFPRWPSNYLSLEKIGNEAFIAWTDPVKKTVRLVAVAL